jgi:hypothetical protein
MSFFKSKEDLDDERRARQAKEAQEALGEIEIPILMDHNYDDLVAADAIAAARAAARETKRAAERAAEIAAEAAYAAEIAAEIPEAQKARKLLTEYWKNMNEYKARHMNADGLLIGYSKNQDRPNKNWEKVYDACRAAAAAYRYKSEHSQDMKEKELFEKKFYKYQSYRDDVYMSMRKHDDNRGMYNVQLGIFPSNRMYQGGKKSKYSRKSKSKYSRKLRTKYSRKSKSKYSRKY